ncbi:MAG: transposase [Clostridia bacterium]|nr:transposase [Clostridia bacterium]
MEIRHTCSGAQKFNTVGLPGDYRHSPGMEAGERRDIDADWGQKVYRGKKEDGSPWEKVFPWFGYKLHLVVDATYEIPVGFSVTKASAGEVKEAHRLLEEMAKKSPEAMKKCRYFLGDRGYDDGKLITKLWADYGIKPLIDIRNLWRDREENRLVSGQKNVVYNYKGQVYCHCQKTDKRPAMAYGGFEKDRGTLKYRCPARHYGTKCAGIEECRVKSGVRIPLKEDRRIFTPLVRSSYRWKSLYKKRTAVERVNSRLDRAFGFEQHYIRGLEKMQTRCTLALIVMLVMALGRVKEKDRKNLRSLVKAA